MSDEQFGQLLRWFEKLSGKVDGLDQRVARLETEVHEVRELMAHLQDDDRVQRHAIANLARQIEST